MATKKMCQVAIMIIGLSLFAYAHADDLITQTIQINTRLQSFYGNPTWLLILRDEDSQRVMPYLFDFYHTDNTWVALSFAHRYSVTVSTVDFGPLAKINNFCHLENRCFTGESMTITLRGVLSPNRWTSKCYISQYRDYPFPIVHTNLELNPPL